MIVDIKREVDERLSRTSRIATAVGVHRNTVMNWRSGRTEPSFSEGVRLAKAIGLEPDLLSAHLAGKRAAR